MIGVCGNDKWKKQDGNNDDFDFWSLVFGEIPIIKFSIFDKNIGKSDPCDENKTVQNSLDKVPELDGHWRVRNNKWIR